MQDNLANALSSLSKFDTGTVTMREAFAVYQDMEKEWMRERVPLDWAMVQHNIGDVIARRESGIEFLEPSIAALRRSLEERSKMLLISGHIPEGPSRPFDSDVRERVRCKMMRT